MQKKSLQEVRSALDNQWKVLTNADPFTRNRRNLYAISAVFLLVIIGGGHINEEASLLGGSIKFDRPWTLYAAGFVLLLYAYWKFEMTRPVGFKYLWDEKRKQIWKRTSSFQKMMLAVFPAEHTIYIQDNPVVKGGWPKKSITFDRAINKGAHVRGRHYGGKVNGWRYLYSNLCAALVIARTGRSVSDILLPRMLFTLALILGVLRTIGYWE